ncbi:MAG TPA: hypothetical protein VNO33_23895 [Kofleriaceae bacterium]|nr:hypothetical protein [Kofleriaceae bacterium]
MLASDSRAASGSQRFRFRPRRPVLATVAGAMGAGLLVSSLAGAPGGGLAIGVGALIAALALLYMLSPAWRTEVVVDDDGLEVQRRGDRRFRLAWTDVVRVTAAPASASAFVDGGAPERSLLLPGPGARAPYRITDQRLLFDQIRARVAPERVTEVERLGRGAQ